MLSPCMGLVLFMKVVLKSDVSPKVSLVLLSLKMSLVKSLFSLFLIESSLIEL